MQETKRAEADHRCIHSLVNLSIADIQSGESDRRRFGLGQLREISLDPNLRETDVARLAQLIFFDFMHPQFQQGGRCFSPHRDEKKYYIGPRRK